jgi:hypothetical protein
MFCNWILRDPNLKQDLLFAQWQSKPILTIIGPCTTLKNKEKATTLNWINSAVKLGSLRIQLQNIQAWSYILNKMLVLLILHYR